MTMGILKPDLGKLVYLGAGFLLLPKILKMVKR